jgi:hypothetical protein
MIIFDDNKNIYIQDGSLLSYIRDKTIGGSEMQLAVRGLFNGNTNINTYLNQKVFSKQIFDLSVRKITFRKTNLVGDKSGKKVFLTVLNEKLKQETAGTGVSVDEVKSISKIGEPNYYNNYKLESEKQNNTCPFLAE